MENITLLEDGMIILCIGMGVVFAFLVIMVWAMNIMAVVIKKINNIFPEEIPETNKYSQKNKTSSDSEVALAIALAYSQK